MAQIQNSSTIKEIRTAAGLSISEGFPTRLADSIVPVININPKNYRENKIFFYGNPVVSGNSSIGTTSSGRVTYITGCTLAFTKNAACDVATGNVALYCTVDGLSKVIALLPTLTLTAENSRISIKFATPIKVDLNSNLTIAGDTYTAGLMSRTATAQGFEVEPFEAL